MKYAKYLIAVVAVLIVISFVFLQSGDIPEYFESTAVAENTEGADDEFNSAILTKIETEKSSSEVYLGERFEQSKAKLRNDPSDPEQVPEEAGLLEDLNQSEESAVGNIYSLLESLRGSANQGYYPTGSNLDVTNALLGQNYQKVAFLPASHPRVSEQGQLIDQWGTPYDFHFESSTQVSIRSGGPDKEVYTDDDIILEIE